MILQTLLKETDRGMERRIEHTPVLQVFCGASVLPKWRCPDHTKIEELRNRLTPETHRAIGDHVLRIAHRFGFADASWMDVDSTVQEANIGYPADSVLMKKLCEKAHHVLAFLKEKKKAHVPRGLHIDIQGIRKAAHRYFFLANTAAIHEHRTLFGKDRLKQVGTDKGYYSAGNIRAIEALAINADGVQRPATIKQRPPSQITETLKRRRAGIEPLIQHAKAFGLVSVRQLHSSNDTEKTKIAARISRQRLAISYVIAFSSSNASEHAAQFSPAASLPQDAGAHRPPRRADTPRRSAPAVSPLQLRCSNARIRACLKQN